MRERAFHLAGQVMPMHRLDLTAEPADPQGDDVVLEDIWSSRMYEVVMQATQTP